MSFIDEILIKQTLPGGTCLSTDEAFMTHLTEEERQNRERENSQLCGISYCTILSLVNIFIKAHDPTVIIPHATLDSYQRKKETKTLLAITKK